MAAKKKPKKPATRKKWVDDALRLKAKGDPIAEVARKLKRSPTTVRDQIADATADPADVLKNRRTTKDAQLEAIIAGLYVAATDGDTQAAAIVISVIKEQIKLHGLAAPEKIDINAKLSMAQDSTSTILKLLSKFNEDDDSSDTAERGATAPSEARLDVAGEASALHREP